MRNLNFDSFTKKIYLKAPVEKVYWSWATTKGITSWFLGSAKYMTDEGKTRSPNENIEIGDNYIWEWHNWDGQERGKVLQANGKDFLEIYFAGDCKVSITIEEKGKACLLTLKQYEIPTDDQSKLNIHYGCSNGWTFWLTNLKAYLEHGILLNETEIDLREIHLSEYEFVNI